MEVAGATARLGTAARVGAWVGMPGGCLATACRADMRGRQQSLVGRVERPGRPGAVIRSTGPWRGSGCRRLCAPDPGGDPGPLLLAAESDFPESGGDRGQ